MNCKVCGNTSTKNTSVSFFRFPKENKKCRDWAERCDLLDLYEKRGTLTFYKSFRICSDHFDSKDIVFDGRKKKLLQSATPQILAQKIKNQKVEQLDDIKKSGDDEGFKLKLVKNRCRLCATENGNLTDIYGWRGRDLKLESKLKYFPIIITKYDVLPLRMCHQCISKVNQFHDFILDCLKAETKLRTMLDLEGCNKSFKTSNVSLESQDKAAWELEMEKSLSKTPNLCSPKEVQDLPNPGTQFLGGIEDNYKKVVNDNFLNKEETACFCKQPEPVCAKTNQLINHTNFIKEVDISMNISFEHDYSNMMSRDQLLLESEIQIENDQNFIKETKHPCDICLESFCSVEVLNAHYLSHSVRSELSREFICETCNKAFFSRFEFDEHISEHHEKYVCKICDKKFQKVAFLERHSLLHQLENSFDCFSDLRPSKFHPESDETSILKCERNKPSLFLKLNQRSSKLGKINFNRRNPGRQFCKKLFKNQVCLTQERNPADTPHQCKQCGKTFRSRPSLRQHRSVHSDKRLYNCQECGMSFKRKDTLSNHFRIHTGERPFVCKVCGFAFKQRGDCMKHEKNHQKTCGAEVKEDTEICNISVVGSSTDIVDVSGINDGALWDDEKNSSLFSYITITEELTQAGSLEDMVAGRIPLNF